MESTRIIFIRKSYEKLPLISKKFHRGGFYKLEPKKRCNTAAASTTNRIQQNKLEGRPASATAGLLGLKPEEQ